MGWIELAEEDRERLGAPERIPLEYGRFGLKSIDALETQVGLTLEDVGNLLQRKKRDAAGNVVTEDELDDDGNPVLNDDGSARRVEVTDPSKLAIAAVAWLALRAIGIRPSWDDFELQYAGLRISWSDDDEGKAADSPEDQPA